jgi:hypothetical protein
MPPRRPTSGSMLAKTPPGVLSPPLVAGLFYLAVA